MVQTFKARFIDRAKLSNQAAEVRFEPGELSMLVHTQEVSVRSNIHYWKAGDIESARWHEGQLILQKGKQFIEINHPDALQRLQEAFPNNRWFRQSFFDKIGLGGCLIALLIIIVPLLAALFFIGPFLAERAAKRISPEFERQIGDAMFTSLTSMYAVDSARTRLVQQFYDSLQYGGPYTMRITVVKEPLVNAFAVPGGRIVVFTGILDIMEKPEELAGLLAHEGSHVLLKHSTRSVLRELSNQMIMSLLLGDYGSVAGLAGAQTKQLLGLAYSRELEIEADQNGLQLMKKSGLPQRGIPDLFRKMQQAIPPEQTAAMPDFLSTHPSIQERIQLAEQSIQTATNEAASVSPGLLDIWNLLRQ